MGIEIANITFYKIYRCGYFYRGEDQPLFGSIEETLEDLQKWSLGKKLIETKVTEIDEADYIGNTYLVDIQSSKDSWVVTTWNETASNEGRVASVQAESNVGDATVHMNDIVEGSIPGYATYFWIVPSRNIFASIRFKHPYTAQKPFSAYVSKFMECYTRHVVVGEPTDDSDYPIIGYAASENDDVCHCRPKFNTGLLQNSGQKKFMLDNVGNITKIIRKEVLNLTQKEPLKFWQKMIRQIQLVSQPDAPVLPKITYEIPVRPTKEDIENMFQVWADGAESNWDDFGVKVKGASKIHWVSHSLAREEFELDVEWENEEVVNAASLLLAVSSQKGKILAICAK